MVFTCGDGEREEPERRPCQYSSLSFLNIFRQVKFMRARNVPYKIITPGCSLYRVTMKGVVPPHRVPEN